MVLAGEPTRFFRVARKIVWEELEPWFWKPKYRNDNKRRVRRPPEFMARQLIMPCLWTIYPNKSYRWMEGNREFRHEVGLGNERPAYETIRRAMFYLDESYLRRLNKRILAEQKRRLKVNVDSTGVGTKLFDRRLSHPKDQARDFVMFHAVVNDRGEAFSITIMDGTTSDTLLFPHLMRDIGSQVSIVRAEKRYLPRDNFQLVEDMGAIPHIKPTSISTMNSRGKFAWRHIHFRCRENQERFLREYNQQRRA